MKIENRTAVKHMNPSMLEEEYLYLCYDEEDNTEFIVTKLRGVIIKISDNDGSVASYSIAENEDLLVIGKIDNFDIINMDLEE